MLLDVSRRILVSPLTASPALRRETAPDVPAGQTRVVAEIRTPAADPVVATWRACDEASVKGSRISLDVALGAYILLFHAVWVSKARVYNRQQHQRDASLEFDGLHLTSNRRFDLDGTEPTGTCPLLICERS